MPKEVAGLPLKDQVAWGQRQTECRLITTQTVNAKGLGSLSAIMEAAIRDDHIEINPCKKQLLPAKGHAGAAVQAQPLRARATACLPASPSHTRHQVGMGRNWLARFINTKRC